MVLNKHSQPIGIITDRDIAIRVVGKARDAVTTLVSDVMSKAPDSVREETSLETALSHMRAGPYRRLPVVDGDGKLVGIISLDDILDLLSEEFAQIGKLVRKESPSILAAP
jgi:CBS domain-containing protein